MPEQTTETTTAGPPAAPVFAEGLRNLILLEIAAAIAVPFVVGGLSPVAAIVILCIPILYLAVVVIRTKDPLEAGRTLAPQDAALVRSSGPLAAGILILIVLAVVILHVLRPSGAELAGIRLTLFRGVMGLVIAFAELSILFALICLWTPSDFESGSLQALWRPLCLVLALLMGIIVAKMAVSPDLGIVSFAQRPLPSPDQQMSATQPTPTTTSPAP